MIIVINNFTTSENEALTISEFIRENKIYPQLLAINDARCQKKRVEYPVYFNARVRLYENVQELHRIHESLSLISMTNTHLNPSVDLADLPRLRMTHVFISDSLKSEADLYFQSVEVNHQIQTTLLNDLQKLNSYNIGILEIQKDQSEWKFLVNPFQAYSKKVHCFGF